MIRVSIDAQLVSELTQRTPRKHAFHLEADYSELAVKRFLTLVTAGHTVIMSSPERFADPSYLELITQEAQTDFILWPLKNSLTQLEICAQKRHPLINDEGMFIVRTSGTSGKPFKLVLHKLTNFIEKFKTSSPSSKHSLLFFPLDSIAGIETVLECYVKGDQLSSLKGKPTTDEVWQHLAKGEIDSLHVTPSFLSQMMLAGIFQNPTPKQLKRIMFGSEPPQAKVLGHVRSAWPQVELVQGYGMSEIGVLQTLTSREHPELFNLAESNPGRIQEGRLEVRSPCALVGYLNHEQALTSDGWFKTDDIVQEVQGQWQVLGRSGDLLNVGGHKFFPAELEEQLMAMPEVLDVTIRGEPHDMIGTAIVAQFILVHDVTESEFRSKLKEFMEVHIPAQRRPHRILVRSSHEITARLKKNRRS